MSGKEDFCEGEKDILYSERTGARYSLMLDADA